MTARMRIRKWRLASQGGKIVYIYYKRPAYPLVLFILFFCICILGTLFLFSGSGPLKQVTATQQSMLYFPSPLPRPTPTSIPTAQPTPTPMPFVPQASPQPVVPFPIYVSSQVAILQAHDRFFSYGNPYLPEIALTFDDGPNPPYTGQILDVLKQYNVKVTFFDVGQLVAEHPELVKREFDEGHIVGNHTWTHAHLPTLSSADIQMQLASTADEIQKVIGVRPTFFRPPYGEYDAHVLTIINQMGLTTFEWNRDARDWLRPAPAAIAARIVNVVRDGAIILLHDGGGNRANTVAALPSIIEQLQAKGYHFVTLSQLVADAHKSAA